MALLKQRLNGLCRILVSYQLLEEEAARQVAVQAQQDRLPLVSYIVNKKILNSRQIASAVLQDFGLPWLDLTAVDLEGSVPKSIVNEKLIRQHHILPLFKRGNYLFIAVSDPTNQTAIDEIKFNTGLNIQSILVEEDRLHKLIEEVLNKEEAAVSMANLDADLEELDISSGEVDVHASSSSSEGDDDAPIVRFVNKILLDAINRGASDLHFEPYETSYRVRFRQDGILQAVASPPHTLGNRIASRLKVMSRLDISERRIPQDGRFKMTLSRKRSIDFRISTCPTTWGEKIVMRILDPSSATLGIDALGYFEDQKRKFLEAIHKPQGMVLVTGPTGSGKTVSLYTAINILNTAERNISTAEDPVEINLTGVNQVNVNPKTGLTFAAALKSFLRQDPDVIMVGEIRDLETAEIGIKAAQTGHLLLSTLHTNSAAETLTRMLNMGVAAFNIATAAKLVIAQRLARRLCSQCKEPLIVPPETLMKEGMAEELITRAKLYAPKGCDNCSNGYKGRIGLYEVMEVTQTIAEVIMRGGNSIDILKQAKAEGMVTLRESGLIRVAEGFTTLEEINRVTKE